MSRRTGHKKQRSDNKCLVTRDRADHHVIKFFIHVHIFGACPALREGDHHVAWVRCNRDVTHLTKRAEFLSDRSCCVFRRHPGASQATKRLYRLRVNKKDLVKALEENDSSEGRFRYTSLTTDMTLFKRFSRKKFASPKTPDDPFGYFGPDAGTKIDLDARGFFTLTDPTLDGDAANEGMSKASPSRVGSVSFFTLTDPTLDGDAANEGMSNAHSIKSRLSFDVSAVGLSQYVRHLPHHMITVTVIM